VYYGDAEPILAYPWVIDLGIGTVEQLREHFDADPQRRATADAWKTNIERYGAPTWYEWRCEHWGTKWNAYGAKVTDIGDGSLRVQFDTAWSLPFPIFETVVSAFPQLLFEGLLVVISTLSARGAMVNSRARTTTRRVKPQQPSMRKRMRK
jgi:hypothetical protein